MKTRIWLLVLACGGMAALPLAAQTNRIAIFPGEDALTPEKLKLVWSSTPGLRYEVKQSTNLQSWSATPGYPAIANGPAQQMPFLTDGKARFFQVRELDEQPPAIVSQYPPDGGFAVPRFSNLTLQLSDATGLDTNSIRLTVGSLGPFTLANTNLTWASGVLTLINGGSIPLGGWGTNVQATLVAADTLGHRGTNTWSFSLETQPQVVTNLFVFGSPHAQRTGQRIGNIPTAALAARFGAIPKGGGEPWTLELVESNRLVLSYTNTAPGFATNTYVCNLTPARSGDIFNRKITAITDDPGKRRLTLSTVEVPLTEIATNGATTVSANSMILQTGTNGVFTKAFEVGSTITFPRIGYSLDGVEFKLKDSVGGFEIVKLTLEEHHWWLTPRLQVGLEVNWGTLKRFEAIASGNVDAAAVWNVDFLLAGIAWEKTIFELPEALQPKTWMFLGAIGPVPVYASLGLDVALKARAEAHATVNLRAGLRQSMDVAFGVTYNRPNVQWVNTFNFPPPEVIPFTAKINAEGSLTVSLEPALEFLVYGLAGVSAGITPSAGLVFEIGTGQPLSGRLEADVTLDLGLAGPAFEWLTPTPELSLPLWHDEWHLFPDDLALSFTEQPRSQTVEVGHSAYFFCTVAASGTPSYQWYFNGVPLPGQTARTLLLPGVSSGHAGDYLVRVTAGKQSSNSAPATLAVVPLLTAPELDTQPGDQSVALGAEVTLSVQARGSGPLSYRWTKNGDSLSDGVRLSGSGSNTLHIANVQVNDAGNYRVRVSNLSGTVDSSHGRLTVLTNVAPRPGLVWIAPGTFVMGSPASEKERRTDETQHTVTLTKGFYLGKYAVTQGAYLALMGSNPSYFTTRDWNGNAIPPDLNRPVEQVSWDDATNYCAHLTVQEQAAGRLPVGWVYRLPTESEREYACRAGTTTAFHYGNALHGGMANFYNGSSIELWGEERTLTLIFQGSCAPG